MIFSSFGFILLTLSLHPVFTAGSPTPCCVSQRVKSDSALTNTAQSPIYLVNIFAKTKLFAKHFGANVGSIHEINKKYKKSRNTVPLIHYREPRKIKLNFIPEITDMSEILKALKKIKVENLPNKEGKYLELLHSFHPQYLFPTGQIKKETGGKVWFKLSLLKLIELNITWIQRK